MRTGLLPLTIFVVLGLALLGTILWPEMDLTISGWFYKPDQGFYLANQPVFIFAHTLAVKGSWALGIALLVVFLMAVFRGGNFYELPSKNWVFLLLALLIGPVLISNVLLKDHWGRARPREIVEFGGSAQFSPALVPQAAPVKNGSFVSGDGSFGFYLTCFAYVVPSGARRTLSRRVFWSGMGAGGLFAFDRLAMGGHFLSDNLFAALLMLVTGAALHAAMFGWRATRDYWQAWTK